MSDEERPPRRGKVASGRVPEDLYEQAQERARKKGRSLGDIIAAFLRVWVDEEYPDPPVMPGEGKRAKMRPRKPKK